MLPLFNLKALNIGPPGQIGPIFLGAPGPGLNAAKTANDSLAPPALPALLPGLILLKNLDPAAGEHYLYTRLAMFF